MAGCCWAGWWGAKKRSAIAWQYADTRWGYDEEDHSGAWVDFWGYQSKATEAAYQSGAKWWQFQGLDDDDITVVFSKRGYYQYSGKGAYRRVRRVRILSE